MVCLCGVPGSYDTHCEWFMQINSALSVVLLIHTYTTAQSKENEEKRVTKEMAHIRKEFKENKGIDGYQRRKYVCKLLYIYMLGYDLDFGHMEAVTLISSNKYQEKLIVCCTTYGISIVISHISGIHCSWNVTTREP